MNRRGVAAGVLGRCVGDVGASVSDAAALRTAVTSVPARINFRACIFFDNHRIARSILGGRGVTRRCVQLGAVRKINRSPVQFRRVQSQCIRFRRVLSSIARMLSIGITLRIAVLTHRALLRPPAASPRASFAHASKGAS